MGIGVVIGFAVVCLSMYMAVLQRTREIGILKALGGSKALSCASFWPRPCCWGLGGTVLGILLSFGAWWMIRTLVPRPPHRSASCRHGGPSPAPSPLVGAVLGALYPGLSAARHDAIEALAYE